MKQQRVTITRKTVLITQLRPHPKNYRSHPPEQIAKLRASYRRLGQFRSLVALADEQHPGDYLTVAGHGCVQAWGDEGAVTVEIDELAPDTPPDVVEAIMVADNLHSQGAEDDEAALAHLLEAQKNAGYDLASLGSDEETLRQMLAALGDELLGGHETLIGAGGDDFDVSPDEVKVRCKRGDVWQLGQHRLLVDDSTKVENVKKLMQAEKAVLMATDPPYGDSWVQKARDMQAHGYVHSHAGLHGSIESDDLNVADLKAFLISFLEVAKVAGDPPTPFYVWHRAKRIVFEQALIETGYFVHQPVVWVKPGFVIGRMHYHPRCEWALHGWRQGNGKCPFYGERNQSDIWEVDRENDKIHPTQKPLKLFDIPILNHTQEDEICYEPFAGSGTQIISAERLGRRCYAMELDEKYASVILMRWEAETGQTAQLLDRMEVVAHA